MTEHTPGPWRRHDMEDDAIVAERPDLKGGYEVANVGNSCFRENRRADVCLIAAAPDLLALATQYRDDLRYPPSEDSRARRIQMIDRVISQATDQ